MQGKYLPLMVEIDEWECDRVMTLIVWGIGVFIS
jgi:hypothetical protein